MITVFFGSTTDSLIVLKKLVDSQIEIAAVVTQPPRPIGRKQILTPTPTEQWAKEHNITVLSFPTSQQQSFLFQDEDSVINTLESFKADLLISASYGQKIPTKTITDAKYGGLNVHPSLLPRWRGADPIPWTILSGDHQTGATVVTLSERMDEGKIIAQKKIPLTNEATHIALRETLFTLGAETLVEIIPDFINGTIKGESQHPEHATNARRLTRNDGFIPWSLLKNALNGEPYKQENLPLFFQQFTKLSPLNSQLSLLIDRAMRALEPWPGVWTTVENRNQKIEHRNQSIRLKLLSCHLSPLTSHLSTLVLDEVQLEGKNPVEFSQIKQYIS